MINFLFSFKGTTGRIGFFIIYVSFTIIFSVASLFPSIAAYPLNILMYYIPSPMHLIITILYIGVPIWIYYAVQVKRMHDIGKSGFWVLINFIPILGFFIILYLGLKKSILMNENKSI